MKVPKNRRVVTVLEEDEYATIVHYHNSKVIQTEVLVTIKGVSHVLPCRSLKNN